jgi:hypothetical protein
MLMATRFLLCYVFVCTLSVLLAQKHFDTAHAQRLNNTDVRVRDQAPSPAVSKPSPSIKFPPGHRGSVRHSKSLSTYAEKQTSRVALAEMPENRPK